MLDCFASFCLCKHDEPNLFNDLHQTNLDIGSVAEHRALALIIFCSLLDPCSEWVVCCAGAQQLWGREGGGGDYIEPTSVLEYAKFRFFSLPIRAKEQVGLDQ